MTSIKKVIFVNRFFYPDHSATSQILGDLAFALAKDGLAVEIITSRLRYDDPRADLPPTEFIEGVAVFRAWSTRFGRTGLAGRAMDYATFYVCAGLLLWRRCGRGSTVVAKTDPPMVSVVVAPIAKLRGATLVNWLQDLFPEVAGALGVRLVQGPVLKVLRHVRNMSLRAAAMNVVLGSRMEARVQGEGVGSDKIKVIHNWADGDAILPVARERNPLRREWGLSDRFVVAYSGNLGRAHEFYTILDAAMLLAPRRDIAFVFIGGGAQHAAVREVVRRRNITNVEFRPYQPRERLRESLSVADVHLVSLNPELEGLIVPSKYYGIAAAGRPTIFVGARDGEVSRILADSDSGFYVEAGESEKLASVIMELADQPGLALRLGQNARTVFDQKFARSIAYQSWKDVLSSASPSTTNASGSKVRQK